LLGELHAAGALHHVRARHADLHRPHLGLRRHLARHPAPHCQGRRRLRDRLRHPTQVGDIPDGYVFKELYYGADDEWINSGDSAIVSPLGEVLAGPAHKTREIIYADIDPIVAQGLKWKLDVAGHYSRPDVFELIVNTDERPQLWKASTVDDLGADDD